MEYVTRCLLEVNGKDIEDFKSFTENEVELHKAVKLMNTTGVAGVTPHYGCKVEYVVPLDGAPFDWESVKNATLTVDYDNGTRTTFTGVYVAKIGEAKVDGENELVRSIELIAVGRM